MISDEFEFGVILGGGLMFIVMFMVIVTTYVNEGDIKGQKVFILDNATYKCVKTNELKE